MLTIPLLVLSVLSSASAAPSCAPTLPGSFKLSARNITLPNTNSTGLPLMVADIQSDHNGRTYQLATVASYPYGDTMVPSLTLTNGGLEATGPDDYAVANYLGSNSPVDFIEGLPAGPRIPAQPLWCAMPPTKAGGFHRLVTTTVNPKSMFKICPTSFITSVFFNVTQDNFNYGFSLNDCFDVELLVVPVTNSTT